MIQYTVELLVNGDDRLIGYYRTAAEKWSEIWSRSEAKKIETLAPRLSSEQFWFEQHCGGRLLGQEIMVVTGFGKLYSITAGFDQDATRARLLYDAFQRSYCSIEVKAIAREVATSYGVLELEYA